MWDAGVEDGNGHYVTLQRTYSKDVRRLITMSQSYFFKQIGVFSKDRNMIWPFCFQCCCKVEIVNRLIKVCAFITVPTQWIHG